MFTPEQEAAFQKEMDGIAKEVASTSGKANSDDSQTHETTEVENEEGHEAEENLESESQDESDDVDSDDDADADEDNETAEEDSADGDSDDPDSATEDDSDDIDSNESNDIAAKKKSDTKEVRKSLARQQRKHEAEKAEWESRFARLETQLASTQTQPTQNNQNSASPVDLMAQRQKRIDDMVARGYSADFAAQAVALREEEEAERAQQAAHNQAVDTQRKFENAVVTAKNKIVQAVIADPELKRLGDSYRGEKLTQPMEMALGQVERPGRVLKHVLKNDPKFIERLAATTPENQYAQMIYLSGKLEGVREVEKQKSKPQAKPAPVGKVASRGQKTSEDAKGDPMKWSSAKLLKEMGI